MILAFNVREQVAYAATLGDAELTGTIDRNPSTIEALLAQVTAKLRPEVIVLERVSEDMTVIDFTQELVARTVEHFAQRHQIPVMKFTPLEWELLNSNPEGPAGFEHDAFTLLQELDKAPQSHEEANAICMAWAYGLRLQEACGA